LEAHEMTDTENVVECSFDVEENREKIRALLQSENPPDGIFATAEKLAVITYELCRELNINIPNDLKIISFSNLQSLHYLIRHLQLLFNLHLKWEKKRRPFFLRSLIRKYCYRMKRRSVFHRI
jgi:hypothetical protein